MSDARKKIVNRTKKQKVPKLVETRRKCRMTTKSTYVQVSVEDLENDVKSFKKVLASTLKRKKKLICEKCGAKKRSVNGYISHVQFCGKSKEERQALMVTCPICKAVMMPSSLEGHERYHRRENKENKEVDVLMEKIKRKAAERAMPRILEFTKSLKNHNINTNYVMRIPGRKQKKIPRDWKVMWKKELVSRGVVSCKQPKCTFTCSCDKTICEHYYQCHFIPQENFMCKICKFCTGSKDTIIDHITKAHSGNNDSEKSSDCKIDEDENSSNENKPERDLKQECGSPRPSEISSDSTNKETTQNPQLIEASKGALHFTLHFELNNYDLELFEDDMPNCFTLLNNNDVETYIPELTVSMAIRHVNSPKNMKSSNNDNWQYMNRFEADIFEAVPTFFVGGPIWALAWLPIPLLMYRKTSTQYIAISTHRTMESEYNVEQSYSGSNIIQIWDVGPLNQVNSDNGSLFKPVLSYAIAHDSGAVWCLEWCPSGCYQDVVFGNYDGKLKRMGLLAAACSNGCINIYSLPFADELKFEKTENNSWPIYKTDPVMTLVVNTLMYENDKQDWQCTKLSWTKERGHSIIAAGFTNGYIALWHLSTTSPLLLNTRGNTKFISAFKYFYAHSNAITMVALVPCDNSRYLASASLEKSYKFWDLEDTSAPQSCIREGNISNGVWATNWPCAIFSFDNAQGYNYLYSLVGPLNEFDHCPILATNSTTYSLAVSDHANSIANGTLAGEITTIFPHQFLCPKELLPIEKQLISSIEIVDLLESKQQDDESKDKNSKAFLYTYVNCKDRFGIIFHDNFMNLEKSITKSSQKDSPNNDMLMYNPDEHYPFTSANRMAWNSNVWSYPWLATGFQNGLVRLLNLNFMSAPHELDDLLS